ncbi:MAG: hypothetical protein AB7G93_08785 [Bdellovibrionales bacterium]
MTDPQIQFQDVDCPKLRSQVKSLIEDLTQLCPSDAAVRCRIRKIHNRFLAEIRVASESVLMQAKDQASALNDVMDHIRTQLLSQIVNWRNHRFAS